MTTDKVYELVDKRTSEILRKFEALETRVDVLELWKSEIMGKLTLLAAIVGFGVSISVSWFRDRLRI